MQIYILTKRSKLNLIQKNNTTERNIGQHNVYSCLT